MSQKERIISYMKTFGSITPVEAFADLGVMRLSARIFDIEQDGMTISRRNDNQQTDRKI